MLVSPSSNKCLIFDIIRQYSALFDKIRHYSTIFDIIRQFLTLFDNIQRNSTIFGIFRQYSTFFENSKIFDIIQHYSTLFDIIRRNSTILDHQIMSKNIAVHNFTVELCRRGRKKSRSTLGGTFFEYTFWNGLIEVVGTAKKCLCGRACRCEYLIKVAICQFLDC